MALPDVVVWEYETDLPGLFAPYEDKLSNEIEKAYVKNQNDQHLDLGTIDHLLLQYEIDFVAMIQTSKRSKLSIKPFLIILSLRICFSSILHQRYIAFNLYLSIYKATWLLSWECTITINQLYIVSFAIFFTLDTGKQRTIRRQKYSGNSNIGSGIVWQWMTEKGWVVYDIEAVDAIERAYNQGKPECDLCNL